MAVGRHLRQIHAETRYAQAPHSDKAGTTDLNVIPRHSPAPAWALRRVTGNSRAHKVGMNL